MSLAAADPQPSWACDVCGGDFETDVEEPHMPHEPGCRGGAFCTCDIWACEPCCWECQ